MHKLLASDLANLGLKRGDTVLVHSSLRALGDFPNKAAVLMKALKELLGEDGTLLVPSLSYATVTAESPIFDILNTPSCIGAFAEYFRNSPDTIRSLHPTHSVSADGRHAYHMVQDHHLDHTPVGKHSPFTKVRQMDGYLMFVGCGLRPNTSIHGVEELVVPPYLFDQQRTYEMLLADGSRIHKSYIPHNFKGWEQRYDRLLNLLDSEDYRVGKVGNAQTYVFKAKAVWQKGLSVLQADPMYFVDAVPNG